MLLIKNSTTWAGLGALTLAASLLLERFATDLVSANFLVGMLIGMSLVFNVKFLMIWRTERVRASSKGKED